MNALLVLLLAARAHAGPVEDAQQLIRSGEPQAAIELLNQRLAARPDDLDARFYLGQALTRKELFQEAAEQYQLILSSRPDHHDALLGLARLERYAGRWDAARGLLDRAAAAGQDPEVAEERKQLERAREAQRCAPGRWTARLDYLHEALSFAGRGNGVALGVEDSSLHRWRVRGDLMHARRFGRSDEEFGLTATHPLPFGTYAGGSVGVGTGEGLFPRARVGALGGAALGYGFSTEIAVSYRSYDAADVYSFAPSLAWESGWVLLDVGYGLVDTRFLSGARGTPLSSYRARAKLTRFCAARPWIAYARTHEAFEPGSVLGVSEFSADHYLVGADADAGGGWSLFPSYEYEYRPVSAQHVNRWGLGLARRFGSPSRASGGGGGRILR